MGSVITSILMSAILILFYQYLISTSHTLLHSFDSRDIGYSIFVNIIYDLVSYDYMLCRVEANFTLNLKLGHVDHVPE
jgi:hypothetical protein